MMTNLSSLGESLTPEVQARLAATASKFGIPTDNKPVTDPAQRRRLIYSLAQLGCESTRAKSYGATDQAAKDASEFLFAMAFGGGLDKMLPNLTADETALMQELSVDANNRAKSGSCLLTNDGPTGDTAQKLIDEAKAREEASKKLISDSFFDQQYALPLIVAGVVVVMTVMGIAESRNKS